MATPSSPTTTLGQRLEQCRQSMTPVPSFRQLERRLVATIGEYAPSSETLRRWHRPTTTDHEVDVFVLLALADIYGTTLRKLAESAADLLSDLGERSSGWLSPIAA